MGRSPLDGSEDELAAISDEDFPIQRSSKRRRLNSRTADRSDADTTSGSDNPNYTTSDGAAGRTQESTGSGTPQEKPKSKYRIHVPKNGDLPKDAFYTQPPQRSSSPYRIEPFCWQKPTAAAPVVNSNERIKAPSPLLQRHIGATRESCHQTTTNGSQVQEARSEPKLSESRQSESRQSESRQALKRIPEPAPAENYEEILADIPSDAFSSPERPSAGNSSDPIDLSSYQESSPAMQSAMRNQQSLRAPQANLRQTTLFGQRSSEKIPQSQSTKLHNWPLASREEPPTHHELDSEALQTWVYPTNLGSIRDYQYSITAKGLYHNLLVALPTGLGKTFIAATVMLNWFRWTRKAQIIFVAPTRPLVSQQVIACFEIAGIPRADTTMLTGNTPPGIRAEEWLKKRVFFMTPQTLINDLKSGMCDPKKVVLLVVDEAHRATGNYAYVEVVKFLKRFNTSFRVLALTATPGASIETVQEVIDGLGISRIEIRTEDSLDIRQYVHSRKIDTVIFDNSDEMALVMELFSRALQPILDKLNGMNAYWNKDPMALTPYGCNQARGTWMQSDAGRKANFGLKGMVNTIFSLLASLSHGTELLKFHGIGPFFQKVLAFRNEAQASGEKCSKYKKQIIESEPFQKMMTRVQSWVNNPDFVGHPKLEYLQSVVMNHFLDAGDGRGGTDPSRTRIMVFAHYRDSAEEIARVLSRNEPMIRPHVFVGQANSKNSEGMDQATQLAVIKKFQDGIYNTLVATSIGEEGLDIGQVDLIVCYDASASPIRMLQRMGRTGRKRAGNIVVTLMRGKEENNFIKAKDNYEKMQCEIASGNKFSFHDESSRRIVPKTIQPVVDKKVIDIPPENTQPDLPEPTKRAKPPKRPAKKFSMPDNVRTGFVKASRIDGMSGGESESDALEQPPTHLETSPEPIPALRDTFLSAAEKRTLERNYLDVKGDTDQVVAVPSLNAFPNLQRLLRPVQRVKHGRLTRRVVGMLSRMHDLNSVQLKQYERNLCPGDREAGNAQAEKRSGFLRIQPCIQDLQSDAEIVMPRPSKQSITSDLAPPAAQEASSIDLTSDVEEVGTASSRKGSRNAIDTLRVASSAFSPPSLANSKKPFYISQEKSHDWASESGDDLPEFDTLVGNRQTASIALVKGLKPMNASPNRRQRAKRMVIQDDSDEE